MRRSKKPKIFEFKIDLCAKLREQTTPLKLSINGYNWTFYQADYNIGEKFKIAVYYQRYVRNPNVVNYIKIYHRYNYKALTKTELNELYELLKE